MIEDHTHCKQCGNVCYYPDHQKTYIAAGMLLCWKCYNYQGGKDE